MNYFWIASEFWKYYSDVRILNSNIYSFPSSESFRLLSECTAEETVKMGKNNLWFTVNLFLLPPSPVSIESSIVRVHKKTF